jgi:transcriptional regulator with XRE-family HTH domain
VDEDTVGTRLRAVRFQRGMSLHDVEVASGGDVKASILGAYERGERGISVARVQRLADLYDVPLDLVIPFDLDARQQALRRSAEQMLANVVQALPRPCVVTEDGRIVEVEPMGSAGLLWRKAGVPPREFGTVVVDFDAVADDYERARR